MRRDDPNREYLLVVASALGDLRNEVVFVGGSVAGLLITDPVAEGNAAAAAGVLGWAVRAYGQRQQGVATSNADKQKARVEGLSARQQQINMRQKMLASLPSQNAGTMGAIATGAGTSFGTNAMRQITQNQNDLMANQANESAQVSLLDQGASNAGAAGNLGAGGTALGGLVGFAKAGGIQGL